MFMNHRDWTREKFKNIHFSSLLLSSLHNKNAINMFQCFQRKPHNFQLLEIVLPAFDYYTDHEFYSNMIFTIFALCTVR